jgi:hypothetical protein
MHAAILTLALTPIIWSGACARSDHPVGLERYTEQKQLAVEHASLKQLQSGLASLEAWHRETRTAASDRLAPGLGPDEIRDRSARLEIPFSDELVALYEWHDGTDGGCDDFAGPALIAYHCFLSLDEALARRKRDRRLYGFPERWFPVLAHQEEYFYVVLDDAGPSALPVFHRLLEDDDVVAFTNLRTLVDTYVEAARTLAWHPDDDAKTRWENVEAIRARRNPMTDPPWAP